MLLVCFLFVYVLFFILIFLLFVFFSFLFLFLSPSLFGVVFFFALQFFCSEFFKVFLSPFCSFCHSSIRNCCVFMELSSLISLISPWSISWYLVL